MKPGIAHLIPLLLMLTIISGCKMQNNSKEIYTLGIWTVKPEKKNEFIESWTEFAKWTDKNVSGPGKAYLLQDETNTLRFISFGPWDNEQSIDAWRETDTFKSFVTKVKGFCDDFQPNTLKVVSASK